jgi:hypothetical protein
MIENFIVFAVVILATDIINLDTVTILYLRINKAQKERIKIIKTTDQIKKYKIFLVIPLLLVLIVK